MRVQDGEPYALVERRPEVRIVLELLQEVRRDQLRLSCEVRRPSRERPVVLVGHPLGVGLDSREEPGRERVAALDIVFRRHDEVPLLERGCDLVLEPHEETDDLLSNFGIAPGHFVWEDDGEPPRRRHEARGDRDGVQQSDETVDVERRVGVE